ncbi:MAG: DUF805 domain-containing protein [Arenicellaceae bacterium]|nr:DUF805 domain-containing protein [Arenicellaceae bacterium]
MNWYIAAVKKYTVFVGRANRAEYWYFSLVHTLVSILLSVLDFSLGYAHLLIGVGLLNGVYTLAVMLPVAGVTIRRLHDTNRSGWWLLIAFIPLLGLIALLVMLTLKGTDGENPYGADAALEPI